VRKRGRAAAAEVAAREFQSAQYPPAAAAHEARRPCTVYSRGYGVSSQRFQKGLLVRTACGRAASGHLLSPLGLAVVGVSRGPPASLEAARGGGRSRRSQRARGEKTGS
jgi:hypothetical protein